MSPGSAVMSRFYRNKVLGKFYYLLEKQLDGRMMNLYAHEKVLSDVHACGTSKALCRFHIKSSTNLQHKNLRDIFNPKGI